MRILCAALGVFLTLGGIASGQDPVADARGMELSGDSLGALRTLQQAAESSQANPATLLAYAEFLDRYRSPDARAAYNKVLNRLNGGEKTEALRRLVLLDLLAGDRTAASEQLQAYNSAGGVGFPAQIPSPPARDGALVEIPGPMLSFSRMAALPPDLTADQLLPALARNIIISGYHSGGREGLEETEYLKLLMRYLRQVRELQELAGPNHHLVIDVCDSPTTGQLLRLLGYRMRGGCGGEVVLETVNASRAFITIDSGFPLAELELALRTNRPFDYDLSPTQATVLYGAEYWMAESDENDPSHFIDVFLSDPSLCRLYLGLSKLDPETASELRENASFSRLRAFAHVIDFFGGMLLVRDGRAVVPGAPRTNAVWDDLVGASPDRGARFYDKLIAADDGWLMSYFDSIMRIDGPVKDYMTDPQRLKRFYEAVRGKVTSPGPARPVFRSNTDLMMLTTRLRMEPDGQPHIPGGLQTWKDLFTKDPPGSYDKELRKAAPNWKNADDVLEAMFALTRNASDNQPLRIFMAMSDINRRRTVPLQPATVDRLARSYEHFGSQYSIFSESPTVSDDTILLFLNACEKLVDIGDTTRRADATGMFQSLVGLWQIFLRNESIPADRADSLLADIARPFVDIGNDADVFEAGRSGVKALLAGAGAAQGSPQDNMMALLAGALSPKDQETQSAMLQEMNRIFEAQTLVSLKTILDIADHSEAVAAGASPNATVLGRVSARLRQLTSLRNTISSSERNAVSYNYWSQQHIDGERKLDMRKEVVDAGANPSKQRDARGEMTAILRDTLVGFNYIYYAPPGAQVLKTNSVFVRSHDFIGSRFQDDSWRATAVQGSGWPYSAGGRLTGSLVGLGYALADAEQNFLIPSQEQALIWGDLTPQMILGAKANRFWNVTPAEMHWVGLNIRSGESALAESVLNEQKRGAVLATLGHQAAPNRVAKVETLLKEGDLATALDNVTPAELLLIGVSNANENDPLARDARQLTSNGRPITLEMISRKFGTPKPSLVNSYGPELLFLRTFPTLMGYSSRIMAETWESNLLYFAAVADEIHLPPSELNLAAPAWTASAVEQIFASHLEDWPALLRSLRKVGDQVREQGRQGALELLASGE